MTIKPHPVLTAMALVLVQATAMSQIVHPALSADQVAAARALQPQRTAQALAFLKTQAPSLGLGSQDGFLETTAFTNTQGQTVVRYQQTFQGIPVLGTSLSVRVDPDGTPHLLAKDRAEGLSPLPAPALSADDAILAAHRNLIPAGAYASAPTAERVIFPTTLSQGFAIATDAKGTPMIDGDATLVGPRPTTSFVQAYLVKANLNNPTDGYREYNLVVSAETGQILRKWDDAAHFVKQAPRVPEPVTYANRDRIAASRPVVAAQPTYRPMKAAPAASSVSGTAASFGGMVPAKGWGYDLYLGLVSLDTAQSALGSGYDLVDLTRGTARPHPVFGTVGSQTWYADYLPAVYFNIPAPPTDYEFPYLGAYYGTYAMDNVGWSADGATPAGSVTNIWGDGLVYDSPYAFRNGAPTFYPTAISQFHYGDTNGMTYAVGAHNATAKTYDMYKYVFGWLGVDGKDSGLISVVHDNLGGIENAHFSYVDQQMHYGDGSWSPLNPKGYKSFATVSIGGHEVSHGVMHNLAAVNYYGESMGLNEASSDIMGMCVEAHALRDPGDPIDRIPDGKAPWQMAPEISPDGKTPLRWMDKPSKDGLSPNAWYAGINNLDGHFSSGVPNRFFYFLVNGASSDSTSDSYSPYMPQGMRGIGIDQAGRIWFKAISEYMTSTTGIRTMRQPLLDAVADLYGADSAQGQAVANALAAVNVGAAYGTAGRPLVTLPNNLVDPYSPLGALGLPTGSYASVGIQYLYYTVPMAPIGEKVKLHVNVTNTTNTEVKWSTGWDTLQIPFPNDGGSDGTGASGPMAANGSFDAEGYYHPPLQRPQFCMTRATSQADPLEFAYMPVMTVNLDADGDGENDAVDMGRFALCFNLPRDIADYVNNGGEPTGFIYWSYGDPTVIGHTFDDYTLQAWNEAFMNAFGK
ncbi:MAG TPA: M4 family metallopeptidase [Holophagaceae bacterium]|nr:M4 family metallopeptidase [Holophagaceae bacterium]